MHHYEYGVSHLSDKDDGTDSEHVFDLPDRGQASEDTKRATRPVQFEAAWIVDRDFHAHTHAGAWINVVVNCLNPFINAVKRT